jgi:hypothetical protein
MHPLGQHHQEFNMLDWLATTRLRPVLTVFGLFGLLALAACGGGSGAPNNPYVTPPETPALTVAPTALTVFAGVPATLTVTSGVAPFFAFSQNSTVLPVAQNVAGNTIVLLPNKVLVDTDVTITVQDSAGQTKTVAVTVKDSPIFNALTFAPSGNDCGTSLCSGQTGTATVVATGPGGSPLIARQIRFDVVFGPIGIMTTNPASPLVQTLTVATDSAGKAVAGIRALANATTQPAQIRATDLTSGQQQIADFTVVNSTVGTGSPLSVVPGTATITSASSTTCSTGFRIDYYIYGGNPPYTVASTFPTGVTLVNSTVTASGKFFEAITNGTCVNPLTFTIVDSAGKQTTATLINELGAAPPVTPPTALVVTPPAPPYLCIDGTGPHNIGGISITGGTPPYNTSILGTVPVLPAGDTVSASPAIVAASGGTFAVQFVGATPTAAGTVVNVQVRDSGATPLTQLVALTCT